MLKKNLKKSIEIIYGNSNTKGSKRQNDLNEQVISYFSNLDSYEDKTFQTEVILSTPNSVGGKATFKVDIVVLDNEGNIIEVILNKAPYCNLKQNETNAIASRVNEIFRLINDYSQIKLTWFTFSPNNTPYFTKTGIVKNIETNTIHPICKPNLVKNLSLVDFSIREIFITFDWNGILIGQNKSTYNKMFQDRIFKIKNICIQEFSI